jgi:hypothetical protein
VISLIVDAGTLGKLAPRIERESLSSKWANLIAGWCKQYYAKYGKAPGANIQGLYASWAAEGRDKETAAFVEKLLGELSGEYEARAEEVNSQYAIDLGERHLNECKARRLAEQLQGDLDGGDLDKALERIAKFDRVEAAADAAIDLFAAEDEIKAALDPTETEDLFGYPSEAGAFFRGQLLRDSFLCFMAPEKRGKSFALTDLAYRAATQRRKTVFFGVGDMTRRQMIRRFMARASGRPLKAGTVLWPKSILREPDDKTATVEHEEKVFEDRLHPDEAWSACQRTVKARIRSEESYLKLACYPNGTMSVVGILRLLRDWERRLGWVADVVVIDYADILAAPEGIHDPREKIDATWRELRALSEWYHSLVVTATQSDADSYNVRTMGMSNFSNDKRKLAHVTGMVGLNQTREEKAMDLLRLNWIVKREDESDAFRCLHAAGCRATGNLFVKTTF